MAAQMPSELLTEWRAYYNISPWDLDRVEYLAAATMRLMAQMNARKGKKFKLEDFLIFLRKTDEQKEEDAFEEFFDRTRKELK